MKRENLIFMLPCAGGNSFNYRHWGKYLKAKIVPLDYAGHWTRIEEKFNNSYGEMIDDIYELIVNYPEVEKYNISFFGHSMGAMICWSLCQRLLRKSDLKLECLFVASMWAPEDREKLCKLQMSEKEVKDFLINIGQVSVEMFQNEIFKKFFFPAICNDFELFSKCHDYLYMNDKPIKMSIFCFIGEKDPLVDFEEIRKWKECTISEFDMWKLPGDHFFIKQKESFSQICKIINKLVGCDDDK